MFCDPVAPNRHQERAESLLRARRFLLARLDQRGNDWDQCLGHRASVGLREFIPNARVPVVVFIGPGKKLIGVRDG